MNLRDFMYIMVYNCIWYNTGIIATISFKLHMTFNEINARLSVTVYDLSVCNNF